MPMSRTIPVLLLILLTSCTSAQEKPKDIAAKEKSKSTWTLENIFPKESLFGPSASRVAYSHDGAYAAYLYRPYTERRHGSDLWIFNTSSGKPRRVTSVSVMSKFQEATRKVRKDRIKKATKKSKGSASKKKTKASTKSSKDENKTGDQVSKKDADDKKAPRYSGISSYAWSPVADELLFISGGDVYRLTIKAGTPERLTSTRGKIRSVTYLPDGKGFTYRSSSEVYRVRFGSSVIERIDPKLDKGQTLASYKLSPSGKYMAIVSRSEATKAPSRKVSIANYRDRFMKVREVSRQVSDDPIKNRITSIYLYDIRDTTKEDGRLAKVWSHTRTGPRDIVRSPEWAESSDRFVFTLFDQKSAKVKVIEARILTEEELKRKETQAKAAKARAKEHAALIKARGQESDEKNEKNEKKTPATKSKEDTTKVFTQTRVVYEFLHSGGPNTPSMMQPQYLADNRRIVLLTEQTGFRQLHVLDPVYQQLEQLTKGNFEIYPIKISKDRKWLHVTSTRHHPSCTDVYRVNLENGDMELLSMRHGSYSSVAVSPKGDSMLGNFASFKSLKELVFALPRAKKATTLTDSHPEHTKILTRPAPTFFSYENRHGHEIHGHMFEPSKKSSKKRPLLIYVYGGPLGTRKQVVEGGFSSSAYFLARYMAEEHGFVTCTIDPRGVSGYGGAFEKANFEQVGRPQVEDLVDGVNYFIKNHNVDPARVGMHGWSFGGFQTQMCLYTEPDVFACGIAGAGPTEWENYNSWYSTGTIGKSRTGQTDLKKYSLLPLARNLRSKLLLVHGMEDSNVLYQDTVRVYRELLKAGKETLVELFLDPTGGHGLGGDIKKLARARKYEEFLLRCLKP